ncbi:hypothetical protein H5410_023845 [Solanum commersonii]|uniref:Uncharacterized protein n=1 Tax=Solanum commersonii TaxID=4109 RepID=A0A9J5ZKA8_SOLCO|nr:hypothetical protein H5410_023845 [Solanum commersonii]
MSLSGDTFSESSTNSDGLTFEEAISANPQDQRLLFYGPLPISHDQTDMNEVAQVSPSVGSRPIVNALYDPNFAMIGLPVDPFLRQFMFNPDFGNKRN